MNTRQFFHTLSDECQLACLLEIEGVPGCDLAQLQATVPGTPGEIARAVKRLKSSGLVEGDPALRLADSLPGWVGAVLGDLRRHPLPLGDNPPSRNRVDRFGSPA